MGEAGSGRCLSGSSEVCDPKSSEMKYCNGATHADPWMFGVPKFVARMWSDSTFWSQTWFVTTWRGDLDANLGYEVESGGVCSSGNIHGNIMEISCYIPIVFMIFHAKQDEQMSRSWIKSIARSLEWVHQFLLDKCKEMDQGKAGGAMKI